MERIAGYSVLSVLGHGANSTIYCVEDSKHNLYALKRVVRSGPSDQRFIDQAINEYQVASQINHPIVRQCFKVKRRRKMLVTAELYLLMEFIDGRSLVQERPATLRELIDILLIVCEGMEEMHRTGYVHCDIKPNNIMTTERGETKLIDFGHSCPHGTVKDRIQGTPDYIAPEQVRRRALTRQTDIFSLGASIYWLLTDKFVPTMIPKDANEIGMKEDVKLHAPTDYNPDLPMSLNNLVLQCVKKKPRERPTSMKEIRSRLKIVHGQLDSEQPSRASRSWPPQESIPS